MGFSDMKINLTQRHNRDGRQKAKQDKGTSKL